MRRVFFIVLAAAAIVTSCAAPKDIVYFQDSQNGQVITNVQPQSITLRPEDKISIIVNCPGIELMQQFNLPYITRYLGSTTANVGSGQTGLNGYVIDSNGYIDFPVVGSLKVAGLTRDEVAKLVKEELQSRDLVKDPVVTVDFMNLYVSLLGEVARPGRYAITQDRVTVLDAISMAGDLTINGRRQNIRLIREENGVQKTYMLDLCSVDELTKSPVYYIRQNDVIYVEPNDMRARQSTVNGNTLSSASFWMSMTSLAATLVSTITVVALRLQNM